MKIPCWTSHETTRRWWIGVITEYDVKQNMSLVTQVSASCLLSPALAGSDKTSRTLSPPQKREIPWSRCKSGSQYRRSTQKS
eukprot:767007-Hanusia_phi.AAC.2